MDVVFWLFVLIGLVLELVVFVEKGLLVDDVVLDEKLGLEVGD